MPETGLTMLKSDARFRVNITSTFFAFLCIFVILLSIRQESFIPSRIATFNSLS